MFGHLPLLIVSWDVLRYPNCNSRWSSAEGGRVWCQDPKKVPRKFREKAVHGSSIRSAGSSEAAKEADVGGGSEADQDAAKVQRRFQCACVRLLRYDAKVREARTNPIATCAYHGVWTHLGALF